MSHAPVVYAVDGRLATITLNRPDKRNALNAAMVTEVKQAFQRASDDAAVKVIILKANGKAFSAGADLDTLQRLQSNSYEDNLADSQHLMELFQLIYTLPKVVIAQVEGAAIAGGCGLATVCDFVFAVPDITFGYSEVRIGFVPAIVSLFLLRKVGEAKAKELLLTGTGITSERAHAMGLVNFLESPVGIEEKVRDFAEDLCSKVSAEAVGATKQLIARVQDLPWQEALLHASAVNATARGTDDCKKGIAAFLNKESISW